MKKFSLIVAFIFTALAANATVRNYLCGITSVTVDTLQSTTKNQFTVTFHQKCKNTSEYTSKPTTFYESDVKIVLNSDDRTLEGTYTTIGADRNSNSANVNDQTINMVNTEFTSGSTSRILLKDTNYVSTFVIENGYYYIGECKLYFSQRLNQADTYIYNYCYDAEEILNEGISPKPFVFSYSGEYVQSFYSYDLTVSSLDIEYSQTGSNQHRYFLTMQCTGIERETNEERNYEVQLAIYPSEENIAGTFTTNTGALLYASNSYVKDLLLPKQRYLANDSTSSVTIADKGDNKYNFTGGPLICTDVDQNYQAVYGKKRVEATHYYYFNSNNGGNGIDFSFDGENASLLPSGTTGLGEVQGDDVQCTKILRNGQVFILRGEKVYTITGREVK